MKRKSDSLAQGGLGPGRWLRQELSFSGIGFQPGPSQAKAYDYLKKAVLKEIRSLALEIYQKQSGREPDTR